MKKHSFTLVEMVVAMSILILTASLIGTASAIFYNAYERSVRATEKLKEYIAIDQVMDQSVRNMIPFHWKNEEENQQKIVFQGLNDSMIFTALRRSHSRDNGALIFVRIRLVDEKLVAEYSSYPLLPWDLEENDRPELYQQEILASGVEELRFSYAERESDGTALFYDEWIEDDHDSIPVAVQMEIRWNNQQTERWLRRTSGNSANSVFGSRLNRSAVSSDAGRGGFR